MWFASLMHTTDNLYVYLQALFSPGSSGESWTPDDSIGFLSSQSILYRRRQRTREDALEFY